jgi:hypothetical protein
MLPVGNPSIILIATGSELQLAFAAAEAAEAEGHPARVVSLPCWEALRRQDQAYRDSVLPPMSANGVSVEFGVPLGVERWVGDEGASWASITSARRAPAGTIFEQLGFPPGAGGPDVAREVVRDGLPRAGSRRSMSGRRDKPGRARRPSTLREGGPGDAARYRRRVDHASQLSTREPPSRAVSLGCYAGCRPSPPDHAGARP